MSGQVVRNVMHKFRECLTDATSSSEILNRSVSFIGEKLGADRAIAYVLNSSLKTERSSYGPSRNDTLIQFSYRPPGHEDPHFPERPLFEVGEVTVPQAEIPTLFISDVRRSALGDNILNSLISCNVLSWSVVPIFVNGRVVGWIELQYTTRHLRFRREDTLVLEQLADYIGFATERLSIADPGHQVAANNLLELKQDETQERYRRLAEYGNLLILKADKDFCVSEVVGNVEGLLGINREDLLFNPSIWKTFVHPVDLRRLTAKALRLKHVHATLNEEVRITNCKTGRNAWLLLKAVPILSNSHEFLGWEGFGIDITQRREAEEALSSQRRRLEALYELSRVLELNVLPATVASQGLKCLLGATSSDSGFGCLYDASSGKLEIVATEGLSQRFVSEASMHLATKGLVRLAVEAKDSIFIPDIQNDPRAALDLVRREGLRAAIIVPFSFEKEVLGALVLYRRGAAVFSRTDLDLVTAAASQIGLAVRQAERLASERRQSEAVSALYALSHEVAKYPSPRDLAQAALPILQKELGCKRMWLGVLSDQGGHIVGHAGFGPGITAQIINIQIELALRHDFFDEALKTKQPVVVSENSKMECSGLNHIMQRLQIGTFVVLPLVSLGRVVGVLVVEPMTASSFFAQKRLALSQSMANELASVIMARRFEARMAEENKMRMAGVLAAGVAHNFNNLLTAIMGQAGLLKMQLAKDSPQSSAAGMILTAAEKGAALTKQLLSFSRVENSRRKATDLRSLIDDSMEIYQSILGTGIKLEVDLALNLPSVLVDAMQLQQALTNLLVNAKEAIGAKSAGVVKLILKQVKLLSGAVDANLPPGEYVQLDIEDNGIGMDEDRLARCFEPFYTTKSVDSSTGIGFGGVGLGLSSAYAMMKNHGGIITVNSEKGEGTSFSLYFPVTASLAASGEMISNKVERIESESCGSERGDSEFGGVESEHSEAKSSSRNLNCTQMSIENMTHSKNGILSSNGA